MRGGARLSTGGLAATLVAAFVVAAVVAACGPASPASPEGSIVPPAVATPSAAAGAASETPAPSRASVELTVYAAASLRDVLEPLKARYAQIAPWVTVTISTGASSALRTQIEQGAPADVFLSADTKNPAALVTAGLTAGEAKLLVDNRLTIIVPTANPAGINAPGDLAHPGVKIVAAADAVPITKYAEELVTKLAALPGSPPGFAASYAANVVSREDDVKAVVAKIELGEGDAAIVYATDAVASDAVTTVAIPPEAEVIAQYAGAVVGRSAHLEDARAFLDWLNGSEAQEIFGSFGFRSPGS
ncbi:MAG: molybdate transport system substrate-binding protein [Chloroflexota bacterium]|nr:molybdate transport system substrate-binding protein [Chloroflexota bacterium]